MLGGIFRIVYGIRVRKEIKGEWLLILSGLLAIVLGVMLVTNPPALFYTFTDTAAPRIQRATQHLVGKAVAVTVDGQPISVAQVSGPFGKHMMTSNLDWEEAHRLLQKMTGEGHP